MVAITAVETGQTTKGKNAMDEGEMTPPPLPLTASAVPKRREPTPDHPPYSWMISEAIEKLSEDGGSAEGSISDFIRARHPGVPAAHDRFLQHYLAKHVTQGLFLCTAPGRYSRCPDEPVPEEAPPEKPAAAASVVSPVTQVKRGRGRPRKDGSTPSPATGKKEGSKSASATPKRRGRPRMDGSLPSPPAVKKEGSKSTSATPKRRGRPRRLALVNPTDVCGGEVVLDKNDGDEPPSTAAQKDHGQPSELALMVANDGFTMPSVTKNDGSDVLVTVNDGFTTPSITENNGGDGEAPSVKLMLVAKDGGSTAFTTPEGSSQPCELVPMAADDSSAPALVADKNVGGDAASAKYKRRRRPCKSAPVNATEGSAPTSIADKAASPTTKGRGHAFVAGRKAPSVPVKPPGQPRKLYLPAAADELPDHGMFCVLALPIQMGATTRVSSSEAGRRSSCG